MTKEMFYTGKTIEEAKKAACDALGLDEYTLSYQIIDSPKKGFLGIGAQPAKISVSVELPDAPKPKKEHKPAPKKEHKPAPKAEKKVEEKKVVVEEKAEEKKEILPLTAEDEKKIEEIKQYVRDIVAAMGVENFTVTHTIDDGEHLVINLEGEDLGFVIGRRGETMDAIQYLTGLMSNRLENRYFRITLNSGDYRAKREETLKSLAKKKAEAALRYGKSVSLEPMNPGERRIIHSTVTEIEGVHSKSVGTDPNRHVIIFPNERRDGGRGGRDNRGRGGRGNGRGGRGGYNRGRGDRREKPVNPVSQAPREGGAMKDSPETSLYSKIEL